VSNVPAAAITPQGPVIPATSAVLTGVLTDYNAAFGGNLNIVNPSTPQAELSADATSYIQSMNGQWATLLNDVDPAIADGRMQDGIGRIYFMTRYPATATVVSCTCTGQPGGTLPAGSLAQDTVTGYQYASLGAAVFDYTGQITVQFACLTLGNITCTSSSLTKIVQSVPGWDAITNVSPGAPGNNVETRADFEYRRQISVAANAHGSCAAILGAVAGVSGVTDVYVVDNPTGVTVNTGSTNYPLVKNSVFVAVVGGTDLLVGQAIWTKKGEGCNTNGATSVTVFDSSSYVLPYPQYIINFVRPTFVPIYIAVTLQNSTSLPANILAQIQAAVLLAFQGGDGGIRATIRSEILASRFYSGVAAISPAVAIVSILIGVSAPGAAYFVQMGIDQMPTLQASNITLTLV
jgi:hypothetical protein